MPHRTRISPLLRTAAVSLALAALLGPPAAAATDVPAAARRLLTVLAAVGEEYREGVQNGAVTRPVEYQEAQAFLQDAQAELPGLAPGLSATAAAALRQDLAAVAAAIAATAPPDAVAAKLARLRQALVAQTGVQEDLYPPAPPSAVRGAQVFAARCASCHGAGGDGRGPQAVGLQPPPANFTDPQFMRDETPYDFFHVVSLGRPRTAMPPWAASLSVQQRWDVISYLWTLAPGRGGLAEGQGVYLAQCAGCHGTRGDGRGPLASSLLTASPDLSRPDALARRTDADLFAATSRGVPGTTMPGFARTLSDADRWKAVAFLRVLSLGGTDTAAGSPPPPAASGATGSGESAASGAQGAVSQAALTESARLVDRAVAAYQRGDADAAGTAADAYLQFEPLESAVGAVDPGLKTRIEERFLQLRQMLRQPGNAAALSGLATEIHGDIAKARAALQPATRRDALFLEAATIILREGLEIVLVIGALLAYVSKAGNRAMRRAIHAGTAAGIGASLATAFAMGELFHLHPGSSDVLEGVTMLLAAGVLFWVSYWLVSKAEAAKWQRYIRGKVETALSGGRGVALAGAAFLAVYREGFETVLFYQALYASAPGAGMTVLAGLLAGSVALGVVYLGFRRFQVRIPLQQFFFVTGLLLYVMAAIFAGQGIHELQEAGVIGVTAVPGVPVLPLLGIYPSVQSLLAQGLFVVLLLYATLVVLRRRPAPRSQREDLPAQVEALRGALDELRREIETHRRRAGDRLPPAVGERVESLLAHVDRLAGMVATPAPAEGRANGGNRNGGR